VFRFLKRKNMMNLKTYTSILFGLILLGLAACRPASGAPIPMATPTAVQATTTPATNEVVVTHVAATAVPSPTPLPAAAISPAATVETAVPSQTESSGLSTQPVISADGRVIAFTSLGALTSGSHADWAAYAYDAKTNLVELISIRHDGQPAYDAIYAVGLSANGRFAAYYSFDGEITPEDPDICTDGDWSEPCEDLYIYDRQTGQIERIPVGRSTGLGKSYTIALSADGRYVAYDGLQIYDRQTGETITIFAEQPNGETFAPAFAANGDIAFVSRASNLVTNDNNETYDVFVWEAATGEISRVSTTSNGNESDDVSGAQPFHEGVGDSLAFSADGRLIAFTSLGTSLTTDELNQCDDYRDFTRACFALYLHDRQTGETRLVVNGDGDSIQPALSADGRFLTFASTAQNLLPDTPSCPGTSIIGCGQLYLLDTQTGALQLISQSASGDWGNGGSFQPKISADGRIITFASQASNLVPNDSNAVSDIFRYDMVTREMIRISQNFE
jgi:Tol biopolymer transport system component